MIKSLEKLHEAEENFYSFDYQSVTRQEFGQARKKIYRAIRDVEQSKNELNHYKNSKNPWVLISIAYFHKAAGHIKMIYENVLELLQKKVNLPISVDQTTINDEIGKELEKISRVGNFLSEAANATNQALLDTSKKKATHLVIIRSEYRTLRTKLAKRFESRTRVNQDYEISASALLMIYQFLNQDWRTYGEKYDPSKAQVELFSDKKLRKVNQDSYWTHLKNPS